MGKGYSLHIGLNFVDPNHYSGWNGELAACEYDAKDMRQIAESQNFQTRILLRDEATRTAVIDAIQSRAQNMAAGDIFLLTYSGHGSQVPDYNSDEEDAMDETWCLFDGQLIDDELHNLWARFPAGVRILVFSDSCHSGSFIKNLDSDKQKHTWHRVKTTPDEIAHRTYFDHQDWYDRIMSENSSLETLQCSVKLISGCQDDQFSYDGELNGQFTERLKIVWNEGKFNGNYLSFHKKIKELLPRIQQPNYMNLGAANEEFENQTPFSI